MVFDSWKFNEYLSKNVHTKCRHKIFEYEPGIIRYQFGHYPAKQAHNPSDKDWGLLDIYAKAGMKFIVLWNWSDWFGLDYPDMFEPMNPKGFKLFIDECHARKLKVLPYLSPGFMNVSHPDYNPAWDSYTPRLREIMYDLGKMCPGSLGWREYFFSGLNKLLNSYDIDGAYLDGGFPLGCSNKKHDSHVHFGEFSPFCSFENMSHAEEMSLYHKHRNSKLQQATWDLENDFLAEIYSLVKAKNGTVILHFSGDTELPFKSKCWDYQLIGEGCADIESSIANSTSYEPYIVRFNDWSRLITDSMNKDYHPDLTQIAACEHLAMAIAIPYMQFPWLEDGIYETSFSELKSLHPDAWIKDFDVWTEWARCQEEAGFPPVLTASFISGRERYLKYFEVYRQMTVSNTSAYIEVSSNQQLAFPCSNELQKVSIFTNKYMWVVIANIDSNNKELEISSLNLNIKSKVESIAKRMLVLKYSNMYELPKVIDFK